MSKNPLKRIWVALLILVSLLLPALPLRADGATTVVARCNNNDCVGANLNETILNTTNVNAAQFGLLFRRKVDGHVYTQPLYLPNVTIPGKGVHNVVYVATQHNTVYAFDADDPAQSDPLWEVNLGASIPLPSDDIGPQFYGDIQVEVGVTSTPVIKRATGTIYVVAATRETATGSCPCQYRHHLHALDLTSGAEKPSSPIVIKVDIPQLGDATFLGERQLQRVGLLLSQGILYIAFGSYADRTPYHGWLFGYDERTLQQVSVFNTTPTGAQGSIWMGGLAPSVDADGSIYVIAANGNFDADRGGQNYGMSILRLQMFNPADSTPWGIPQIVDWFAPYDYQKLIDADLGFGSTGAVLISGTRLLLAGTKHGQFILINRDSMGQVGGTDRDAPNVQRFQVSPGPLFGSPIYWNSPQGGRVYIWGTSDALKAFALDGDRLNPTPVMTSTVVLTDVWPGGILSLSANRQQAGSGIVWANHPIRNANEQTAEGILRAYDAEDISNELWNSEQVAERDHLSSFAKFTPATVADGKVFVATFSNDLNVYGLFAPGIVSQPRHAIVANGERVTLNVTVTGPPPLHYQWYAGQPGDSSQPVGENSATLTTPPIVGLALYWVRVRNQSGQVDSRAAGVVARDQLASILFGTAPKQ